MPNDFFKDLPFNLSDKTEELISDIKALNSSQGKNKAQLGMMLLKAKEQELYLEKGYKKWRDFVQQEIGMSMTNATRTVYLCERYKQLGLDPKLADKVRFQDFGRILTVFDKGLINDESLTKDYLPLITEGDKKCITTNLFDDKINGLLASQETKAEHRFNVKLVGGDALEVIASLEGIKTHPEYQEKSEKEILKLALANLNFKLAADSDHPRLFTEINNLLLSLNSIMIPGLVAVPLPHNMDLLQESIKKIAAVLPERQKDDGKYEAQVRKIQDTLLKTIPNIYVKNGKGLISLAKQDGEKATVIVGQEFVTANTSNNFALIDRTTKEIVAKERLEKNKAEDKQAKKAKVEPVVVPPQEVKPEKKKDSPYSKMSLAKLKEEVKKKLVSIQAAKTMDIAKIEELVRNNWKKYGIDPTDTKGEINVEKHKEVYIDLLTQLEGL